jgi:hypothetical protein
MTMVDVGGVEKHGWMFACSEGCMHCMEAWHGLHLHLTAASVNSYVFLGVTCMPHSVYSIKHVETDVCTPG